MLKRIESTEEQEITYKPADLFVIYSKGIC